MEFDRQLDQPINQFGIGQSGRFPYFGIHTDRGKTRNRVQFITKILPLRFSRKKSQRAMPVPSIARNARTA